ncbi:unnamed protein product [Penicillium egyptiacum]|uniref:Uncharacterized protein n=1 Tax=Penicillium egyptiacum TaxID=1303716 RepID=A0A9W4P6C6_9EURO|nr:unnamed protein product [Penicillium egyptiacum]
MACIYHASRANRSPSSPSAAMAEESRNGDGLHGLPEDWAKLFRRISVLFPNLEKVEIGHKVLVADKVVKSFSRRHLALRTLERRQLERSILAFHLHEEPSRV